MDAILIVVALLVYFNACEALDHLLGITEEDRMAIMRLKRW